MAPSLEYLISDLGNSEREHVQDLIRRWGFLADLCFSDLLLYLPLPGRDGFVVTAQVRPATAQTVHPGDLFGHTYGGDAVPAVAASFRSGGFSFSEWVDSKSGHMVVSHCIPLRVGATTVAVMARDYMLNPQRIQGELESTYLNIFERFARMILAGDYPYPRDESGGVPRVGDGVVVLDSEFRVTFLSPNGVSALHRIGCHSPSLAKTLDEQGISIAGPLRAAETFSPVLEEIEGPQDSSVTFYCMPLIERHKVGGYLLLVQDVTNIRRNERLLLSKDATIREVHHRVKNNLQTISSLLRLQGRRVESKVAQEALAEAERRIRSIAVVHEVLSREIGEQVPMEEITGAIVRLAQESAPPHLDLNIRVQGDLGELDSALATPLAVVLQELLLNSIEHAFPEEDTDEQSEALNVVLEFTRAPGQLGLKVSDNGSGFPESFDFETSNSLGLLIVRDLIRSQLMGTIAVNHGPGAEIIIVIPCEGA